MKSYCFFLVEYRPKSCPWSHENCKSRLFLGNDFRGQIRGWNLSWLSQFSQQTHSRSKKVVKTSTETGAISVFSWSSTKFANLELWPFICNKVSIKQFYRLKFTAMFNKEQNATLVYVSLTSRYLCPNKTFFKNCLIFFEIWSNFLRAFVRT